MKRKNMKVVGYITCALCMTIMVGLLAIGVQADDKTIAYVEGVTYTADNTIPTAPTGYSVEDGYLFAGWYVADETDTVDGYSPVRNPIVGETYSGYEAAFQAAITPDNVATVVATIEENNLPKALRASDYDPTFDTAYASYFGKYRISTNAFETQKPYLNLEAWKELYAKGYNVLHVDNYMTLVQYIADQM